MGEGQPVAPQLTPSIILSAPLMLPPCHMLITPPNLQTDFLCYRRLLSSPPLGSEEPPISGAGKRSGWEKRVFGKKGPSDGGALGWDRGQSVHACVCVRVCMLTICWGRVYERK